MKWKRLTILCSLLLCFGLCFADAEWTVTETTAVGRNMQISSRKLLTSISEGFNHYTKATAACTNCGNTLSIDADDISYRGAYLVIDGVAVTPCTSTTYRGVTTLDNLILTSGDLSMLASVQKTYTRYAEVTQSVLQSLGVPVRWSLPKKYCSKCSYYVSFPTQYYYEREYYTSSILPWLQLNAAKIVYTAETTEPLGVKSYTVSGLNILIFKDKTISG